MGLLKEGYTATRRYRELGLGEDHVSYVLSQREGAQEASIYLLKTDHSRMALNAHVRVNDDDQTPEVWGGTPGGLEMEMETWRSLVTQFVTLLTNYGGMSQFRQIPFTRRYFKGLVEVTEDEALE